MDVGGTMNKLVSTVERNAKTLGALGGFFAFGINPVANNLGEIVAGRAHIPDVGYTLHQFFEVGAGEKAKLGIVALIAGYALDQAGVSHAKALQDGALGYLMGLFAQHVLYFSTHGSGGSFGSGSNGATGGKLIGN